MRVIKLLPVLILLILASCDKKYEVAMPDLNWDLFNSSGTTPINVSARSPIQGIYSLGEGSDIFGNEVALKWTYVINGLDTSFYLSVFCEKDIAYLICKGKRLGNDILFNGYWRKMVNTETGNVRLTIHSSKGGQLLLKPNPVVAKDSILMDGVFGYENEMPSKKIALAYTRPLNQDTSFLMLAHRCGGRNSDILPASENSVEMVKMASRFGATGVEMDVRLTSDGVPIIFHDEKLSDRTIQPNGMLGEISNYNYTQLHDLVRLKNGENIPTLYEMLDAIVYNTDLKLVWLDIKLKGSLQLIRDIQLQYEQKAKAANRNLKIAIGIPDKDVQTNFLALKDHNSARCINEMLDGVETVNAYAWGGRWTAGIQEDDVQKMHIQGRKAFTWTMDVPEFVKQYINESHFDGILSNYPSIVAYYHYAKR